jgi:predicted Zn-dependent peptidase
MKRILTAALLLLFLPLAGGISDAGDYLKKNVVEKKLKNGITVLLLNRGYAPTLAFEIAFRVGSSDETYRSIGTAHLLEHMLFKGTDKIGTRNFAKEKKIMEKIEAIGETIDSLKLKNPKNSELPALKKKLAQLQKLQRKYIVNSAYDRIYTANGARGFNASTSRDKTGYYIQLPSSKLKLWAKLESERLRKPVLREFYLERNNVLEERRMRYDSKGEGGLWERFIAIAYVAHPYRHPIIGWRSNIPFLSIKDVRKFYYKHYIPSRMTITIVGKQDVKKTMAVVEKYFSSLAPRPEPKGIMITEPKAAGERRFEYLFKSKPSMIIGWHKPTMPSKEDYVFDIVSDILGQGKTSRLYKSLLLDQKLVTSIGAWNGYPASRYNNLFVITAKPRSGVSLERVEKAIYKEIGKMIDNLTQAELKKIQNKLESSTVMGLRTNRGVASLLTYYQAILGDWRYGAHYLKNIKKIKVEDVKVIMKKYLVKRNRIVGVLKEDSSK